MKISQKKVLFFVREGNATDEQKKAARDIAREHECIVPFRNSNMSGSTTTDFVEDCFAVCGLVPTAYADRFPRVSLTDGKYSLSDAGVKPSDEKRGLVVVPDNVPEGKEALREALDKLGVAYHPNLGAEKLKALYLETLAAGNQTSEAAATVTEGGNPQPAANGEGNSADTNAAAPGDNV